MRKFANFRFCLFGSFAAVILGCGGSGGPITLPTSQITGIYVSLGSNGGIAGYTFDPTTGALLAMPNSPYASNIQFSDITWDQANARLFAVDNQGRQIVGFNRIFGGQLGSPVMTQFNMGSTTPFRVAHVSDKLYVSELNGINGSPIHQYQINPNQTVSPLVPPIANIPTLDPVGISQLQVAGSDLVSFGFGLTSRVQFRHPDASGVLSSGDEYVASVSADNVAPSSSGLFTFMVADQNVYSISNANPPSLVDQLTTNLTTNDFSVIISDPLGRSVFCGGDAIDGVVSVSTSSSGMFGSSGPLVGVGGPVEALGTDNLGKWLFVLVATPQEIQVYHINANGSIGALADTVPVPGLPRKMVYVLP
ncbi:MAG: hypothetical protein KF812_02635 [Fimbriimonadaceae bacterium]|nr:hypothetical protein [Fimbriimonadaceae bacterium]